MAWAAPARAPLTPTPRQLEEEVRNSGETLKAFNLVVMQELDMFNRAKTDEFRNILKDYATIHLDYYRKAKGEWDAALPAIQGIHV